MKDIIKRFQAFMKKENRIDPYGSVSKVLFPTILLCMALYSALMVYTHAKQGNTMMWTTSLALMIMFSGNFVMYSIMKKKRLATFISVLFVMCLYSFYFLVGGSDGFAIVWMLLLPFAVFVLVDFQFAIMSCVYFQLLFIIFCWTPAKAIVQDYYHPVMLFRLPFWFAFSFLVGTVSYIQVYRSAKQKVELVKKAELAAEDARLANEAKSNFLANMSHEIRTPINAILGMDEILLREMKDPSCREYALNIEHAGNNLLSLINDILDFSKIESRMMELVLVEYQVNSLLSDCYNMVHMRALDKNLDFVLENNKNIPSKLYGDETRIRQVIVNLLTNAVKYTNEGAVRLSVSFDFLENGYIQLQISVSDTGIGISKENKEKLFQSFQRVDLEHNRNVEGTGLGLTITKQFVDMMEGNIYVSSEYGQGSTFIVNIPQKVIDATPMGEFCVNPTVEKNQYTQQIYAPEAQILVVDDVLMNLQVFQALLKSTGMKIDTALSGIDAIKLAQQKKYDMIFMDHMMPNMDGIETYKNLKSIENLNGQTPTIMLTANAIAGVKDMYLQEGFSDYLTKPVKIEQLEEMLLRYLPKERLVQVQEHSVLPETQQVAVQERTAATQEVTAQQPQSIYDVFSYLDVTLGMEYCGNMEDFYVEMLDTYVQGSKLEILEKAYAEKDYETYRINAHSLKSTSLTIGAKELSEQGKALEFACKDNNYEYIEQHHEAVMKQYSELLDNLSKDLKRTI